MTATVTIARAAATKLAAFTRGDATLRSVRPAAELVSVSTVAGLSTCCGHAPEREEGEDCGCQDVSCRLWVRVNPVVKGGQAREIAVDGDVTLAGGTFQGKDWSWRPMFAERVEALGLDLDDVESAIEADV